MRKGSKTINIKTGDVIDTFTSIHNAYKKLGKKLNGHIGKVCKGERESVYGYRWEYVNQLPKEVENNSEAISHSEYMIRACGKAVKQIDAETGDVIETFRCIGDAERKLKKRAGHISAVCNGTRKTAYGYKWEFVDE